jgi:hypothetical protein
MSRSLVVAALVLLLAPACSIGSCNAQPAVGDSCLVGTWTEVREANVSAYSYAGQPLSVAGLAGALMTIKSDGTETYSFDSSSPLVGTTNAGQRLSITIRGSVTFHVHGDGHALTETGTKTTMPTQATLDGAQVTYTSYQEPGPRNYSCTGKSLTTKTANGLQTDNWSRG